MSTKKSNRKQRKAKWINAKNLMRQYPSCAYNGDFYCNHEYDEENGWTWVDFRFFHTKLKKYFAVAMTTLEYSAYESIQETVRMEIDKTHPLPEGSALRFVSTDKKTGGGLFEFSPEFMQVYNERKPLEQALQLELSREAQMMRPYVDVKDYGEVAVGLWVSLNVSRIDEHVIRSFIEFYRSIGEPITPGRAWTGEEVEIVPERINVKRGSN